jgi:hypothetical protein
VSPRARRWILILLLPAGVFATACGQRVPPPDRAVPPGPEVRSEPAAFVAGRPLTSHPQTPEPIRRDPRPPRPPSLDRDSGEGADLLTPLPPSDRRAAVVIGIDDYPGSGRDLIAATADARVTALALGRLGFGHTMLLLDRAATREAILAAARWLAASTGPGEVGAWFYAGHVRVVGGDPDGDGEGRDEALVAADGRPVIDGEVAEALASTRGRLWLIWAACHAGGFDDAAGPGRVSSYASAEGELAYESSRLGHSFLGEFLIRRVALRERPPTVEEIHRRASNLMSGRYARYRPLVDDRVAGPLVLADRARPRGPAGDPGGRPCLVALRCRAAG